MQSKIIVALVTVDVEDVVVVADVVVSFLSRLSPKTNVFLRHNFNQIFEK